MELLLTKLYYNKSIFSPRQYEHGDLSIMKDYKYFIDILYLHLDVRCRYPEALPKYLLYLSLELDQTYNFESFPQYMLYCCRFKETILLNDNILPKYIVFNLDDIKHYTNLMYLHSLNDHIDKNDIEKLSTSNYLQCAMSFYFENNQYSSNLYVDLVSLYTTPMIKLHMDDTENYVNTKIEYIFYYT